MWQLRSNKKTGLRYFPLQKAQTKDTQFLQKMISKNMTSIYRKGILLEKIMKHLKTTKLKRYSLQQFRLSCGLCALTTHLHQSRICGKGVGSGLFPWLAPIRVIRIYWNCTYRSYYGVENDCRNVRSNRMDSLCKNQKVEKCLFFGHFWANFGYVSHIPVIRF